MYESHYYTIHKHCPCKVGEYAVKQAINIYSTSINTASFVDALEQQRVIGKKYGLSKMKHNIYQKGLCL